MVEWGDNTYAAGLHEVPDTGNYVPFAIMDDGGVLCHQCVEDPSNPVHDRRDGFNVADGWRVTAWDHSGNMDALTMCDHCGRVIVDDEG